MQAVQKRRRRTRFGVGCRCCAIVPLLEGRPPDAELYADAEEDGSGKFWESWQQDWDDLDWHDLDGHEYSDAHCHLDYVIQNEKFGNTTWNSKQEYCRWWASGGACPYGDNCDWAHGDEELEARVPLGLSDIQPFVKRHFSHASDTTIADPGNGGTGAARYAPVPRSMITNCCELASIADTIFLANKAEEEFGGAVYCTFGCHPQNFRHYDDKMEEQLLAALEACGPRGVAWGECGLDYVKNWWEAEDPQSREHMLSVFARQARLAVTKGLPLVVHSRGADEDTLKVLCECLPREHGVHIHAFQGSVWFMNETLAHLPNSVFGVSSAVTLARPYEEALEIARRCPLDRLVLETDAPYLGWEPLEIPKVAQVVARVKGLCAAQVLAAATANCERFYGIEPRRPAAPVVGAPPRPLTVPLPREGRAVGDGLEGDCSN